MNAALQSVVAERARQKHVEGFDSERDDKYTEGQLAAAAASYALFAHRDHTPKDAPRFRVVGEDKGAIGPRHLHYYLWPWARGTFKTKGAPRRCMVKAAALLLAEIERLDRAEDYRLVDQLDRDIEDQKQADENLDREKMEELAGEVRSEMDLDDDYGEEQ